MLDELAARIEANGRTRPCRPWLGVVRPGQDSAGWEVVSADRIPSQRSARFPQLRACASQPPEQDLTREVMAEVLTRLPGVDLPEHVRERSAVVARAAIDEADQGRPPTSKVLRLRDCLVDLLRAGMKARPSQQAQELLGVVRRLY